MRQLEYVQILYALHFDSLQKNEHGTRTRSFSWRPFPTAPLRPELLSPRSHHLFSDGVDG